ncbi:SpoIIE family protein phosphatase [Leeia oryzae]|uniref:SpoIIE family protein phosphatase n=1 Tax=Leeia oryzae TaxID=356662 RepID=UPI000368C290|nr:SpoIIE family protein phosphatase [Leeia oryzae]
MLNMHAVKESRAGLTEIESEYIARSLMRQSPTVTPQNTSFEVLDLLATHHEVIGLPVLENGRAIGLINRNIFNDEMAKPFRRDLYGRKSCIAFMDKQPLVVNEQMSIQELSFKVIAGGGKTLNDGFIITDNDGMYLGIGTGEDLVKVVSYLQAEKNRLVMESINYASVIQKSFMRSSREDMAEALEDYFIHWEPRDKVGGDYYFCKKFHDGFFIALIDCTGHGVPGAFMTLIMAAFLDHILLEDNRHDPAGALALMNQKVKTALGQISEQNIVPIDGGKHDHHDKSDDGMDTAFCWVSQAENKMVYAGAKTPLFLLGLGDTEITIIEGDKKGVGYVDTPMDYTWRNQEIRLDKGMSVYLTTDGIIDQIGGSKEIAFGKKRFCRLLLEQRAKPMAAQAPAIMKAFYEYQGSQRRRDDVSFLGFRI